MDCGIGCCLLNLNVGRFCMDFLFGLSMWIVLLRMIVLCWWW